MTTEQAKIEPSIVQKSYPAKLEEYVNRKLAQNGKRGRPSLLCVIAKTERDPKEELLNIIEQRWIKDRSPTLIAKDYDTEPLNIFRLLKDVENIDPTMKEEIVAYIRIAPRRKRWYLPEMDTSDYETVQNYIRRARRDQLKRYKEAIKRAQKVWVFMGYQDPQYWSADKVCEFLATLPGASASGMLDAIRQVAPQIAIRGNRDQVQTGRFREKIGRRKKDIFGNEVQMIRDALRAYPEDLDGFDLHISVGSREGCKDPDSGLAGFRWTNFKEDFSKVDDYESKVRGGITWRDCPVNIFFADLPQRLKALWTRRGKPTDDRVFPDGYKAISTMYKRIRSVLEATYTGKIDPSLLKEFMTLKPHDADKIHVNLLWEAGVPLEVVGGQYLGKGEGLGLMGRGWLDINVIKKHYLALTGRSERMMKLQNQVREYSHRFHENQDQETTETIAPIPLETEAPIITSDGFNPSRTGA